MAIFDSFKKAAASQTSTILRGNLDEPRPGSAFSSWIQVRGWATAMDGAPVQIALLINGELLAQTEASLPRPDVAAHYPTASRAAESGFEALLKRSDLPALDSFVLTVEARTAKGEKLQLGEAPIEWAQSGSPVERGDYRRVWDGVSGDYKEARLAVCGTTDLAEYERSGIDTADAIVRNTALQSTETVLEIGCGTGRIGLHLAPRCAKWIGADVSENMLEHARQALQAFPNVEFANLNGSDLSGFGDAALDVVYCSAVFMHLDEWDRFRYVTEMFRVLKPGGRFYYDNFNLLGAEGWDFFAAMSKYDPLHRPRNISKSSTPQELERYAAQAGFENIRVMPNRLWIQVAGNKPR